MATRLYLHAAANAVAGTFPSGEQSTLTANVTGSGASTIKSMNATIGTGQTTITYTTLGQTTRQFVYLGMWVSPTLNTAQTFGGSTWTHLNLACSEANLASNAVPNTVNCYIWRPSTGAKVATLRDFTGTNWGGAEPLAAGSMQAMYTEFTTNSVTAQGGDVIVLEIWMDITQAMGAAYANSIAYDGTTVNDTPNAVVTNHASFLEFTETITFGTPGLDLGPASASCVSSASATGLLVSLSGSAKAVASAGRTVGPWTAATKSGGITASMGNGNLPGLLAFCQDNFLLETTDGTSFASVQTGVTNPNFSWGSLPNLLVALERINSTTSLHKVRYSSDGTNFTDTTYSFTSGANSWFANPAAGNGELFFFMGPQAVKTSNGTAWTFMFDTNIKGQGCYNPGLGMWLTYASGANAYATSTDGGATWTPRTLPTGYNFASATSGGASVAALGSMFIAVASGTSDVYFTSTDGINWTSRTRPFTLTFNSVAASDKKFYWGGWTTTSAMASSSDGVSWATESTPALPLGEAFSEFNIRNDDAISVRVKTNPQNFVSRFAASTQAILSDTAGGPVSMAATATCAASASATALTSTQAGRLTCAASASGILSSVAASLSAIALCSATMAAPGLAIATPIAGSASATATARASLFVVSGLIIERFVRSTPSDSFVVGTDGANRALFATTVDSYILNSDADGRNSATPRSSNFAVSTDQGVSLGSSFAAYRASHGQRAVITTDGTIYDLGSTGIGGGPLGWATFKSPYGAPTASGVYDTAQTADSTLRGRYAAADGTTLAVFAEGNGLGTTLYAIRSSTNGTSWTNYVLNGALMVPQNMAVSGSTAILTPSAKSLGYTAPSTESTLHDNVFDATQSGFASTPVVYGGSIYALTSTSGAPLLYKLSSPSATPTTVGAPPIAASLYVSGGVSTLITKAATSDLFYVSRDNGVSWQARGGASRNLFKVTDGLLTQGNADYTTSGADLVHSPLYLLKFSTLNLASNPPMGIAVGIASASATTLQAAQGLVAGSAACVSTAQAALVDRSIIRAQATATGLLSSSAVVLAGTLRTRSKVRGADFTEDLPNFFSAGNVGVAPLTGLVVTPSHYRSASTLAWNTAVKPNGIDTPTLVASDGLGTVCAMLPNLTSYATSNGSSWLLGAVPDAPAGGWGTSTLVRLIGGGGKFMFVAGTQTGGVVTAWYSWVSTNGRTWTGPTALTTGEASDLQLAATADGFYGIGGTSVDGDTVTRTTYYYSRDGSAWQSRRVAANVYAVGRLEVSAGTIVSTISPGTKTAFFSAEEFFRGATFSPTLYPDVDAGVPGPYWVADAHSSRPMFYRVGAGGEYSCITDPLLGAHPVTTPWNVPAGYTTTGDFVVSDGSLYARSTRTSDSATVGATANVGLVLGDYVEPPGALRGTVSATATASASLSTGIRLNGSVASTASASATGMATSSGSAMVASTSSVSVTSASLSTQIVLGGALVTASAASATTLKVGARFAASAAASSTAAASMDVLVLMQAHAACTAFIQGALRRAVPPAVLYAPLVHTSAPNPATVNLGTEALVSMAGQSPDLPVGTNAQPIWVSSDSPALLGHDDPEIYEPLYGENHG